MAITTEYDVVHNEQSGPAQSLQNMEATKYFMYVSTRELYVCNRPDLRLQHF